jgi:hypothetical protein
MAIKIDAEFSRYLPPLPAEDLKALTEKIKRQGCREPLVVWKGENILLDGHHRLKICEKHDITYQVNEIEIESRQHALIWIIENQEERRNLNDGWRAEYALSKKELLLEIGRAEMSERGKEGGRGNKKGLSLNDKPFNSPSPQPITPPDQPVTPPPAQQSPNLLPSPPRSHHPSDRHRIAAPATPPPPKHNTREQIAKSLGWATGKVAQAEVVKKESPELWDKVKDGTETIGGAYKKTKKKTEIEQAKAKVINQTKETSKQSPPVVYLEDYQDFLSRFEDQSVDLVLTDPPYMTDLDNVGVFAESMIPAVLNKIKPTGRGYIFIGAYPKELSAYLSATTPGHVELKQVLVWTYKNTLGKSPKQKYKQNWQAILYFVGVDAGDLDCPLTSEQWAVQEINAPDGRQGDRFHEWQKPIEIAERIIRHSTKKGDIVIDPFTCTGTFILAASKLSRAAYGCDKSRENLNIALERGCIMDGAKT